MGKPGGDLAPGPAVPQKCPFCQRILEDPRAPACPDCQKTLPWLSGREAERPVEFTSGCLSPWPTGAGVPDSVHRYKFPGTPSYAGAYGLLIAQCVRDNRAAPLDLVTWVPSVPSGNESGASTRRRLWPGQLPRNWGSPVRGTLEKFRNNGPSIPPP